MSAALLTITGPLAAAALILLTRRWPGPLAVAGAAVGLAGAVLALAGIDGEAVAVATLPGLPGLPLRLVVDSLGAVLATTVAAVSLLVFVYALGYMAGDRDKPRFFAAMAFFAAAMQALVLAGDWLLFLAAWELIALASYLLIGFWFDRPGVGRAATRAFATTRAADLGLYLGVFVLTAAAGTTEIAATQRIGGGIGAVAGLALLLAAMGKSAQVPLQGWLLDAMAGPTPVSALLHSATLVVAGVVLLVRADPLLTPEVRLVVGVVGGATAVVTGLMAVAQPDVKRMLAASTSSQLGLMLLALGAGSVVAAVVHLIANAAMKSALFLGAGIVQHARGSTEFAALAGVGRERRAVFAAVAAAGLALAGIPPLAGFWSKDAILAAALAAPAATLLVPLALAATVLTGLYVARMLRLLWRGEGDRGRLPRASGRRMGSHPAAPSPDARARGNPRRGARGHPIVAAPPPEGAAGQAVPSPLSRASGEGRGVTAGRWLAAFLPIRTPVRRGEGDRRGGEGTASGTGSVPMSAALAALVALAASLGLAIPAIGRLLGLHLPEARAAVVLGLAATALGLTAGWALPAARLLGPLFAPAAAGFRIDGGIDELIARPALALGRALDRLDRAIHGGVLAVGRGALRLAGGGRRVDAGVHALVEGTGRLALAIAAAARLTDEAGIDRLIADLVAGTRRLGARARGLQTGLVHRELLVAAAGTAVVIALFVLIRWT